MAAVLPTRRVDESKILSWLDTYIYIYIYISLSLSVRMFVCVCECSCARVSKCYIVTCNQGRSSLLAKCSEKNVMHVSFRCLPTCRNSTHWSVCPTILELGHWKMQPGKFDLSCRRQPSWHQSVEGVPFISTSSVVLWRASIRGVFRGAFVLWFITSPRKFHARSFSWFCCWCIDAMHSNQKLGVSLQALKTPWRKI